jgi:hypothetical protein
MNKLYFLLIKKAKELLNKLYLKNTIPRNYVKEP